MLLSSRKDSVSVLSANGVCYQTTINFTRRRSRVRIPSSDLLNRRVAPEISTFRASVRTYTMKAILIFLASVSIALFFIGAGLASIDAPSCVVAKR